ncbi:hypothetical protein KSS87_017464 [Heliosperma pusillum]|nr:hypothetical protein KSS87_017464 [Heliosperma pusillum]
MGEKSQEINVKELLSFCDDLVGVLRDNRDITILNQCVEHSKAVQSTCNSDFSTTQIAISVLVANIDELDEQRVAIEKQRQRLKKLEEEEEKAQRKLSFYASVTKIIPDLETKSKICGRILVYVAALLCPYNYIVNRDKKVVEKFEFDPAKEDAFDICNKTWKMIDQ